MPSVQFTNLPLHVHQQIIDATDPKTWSLVSHQFLTIARTPWVKAEWLARQHRFDRWQYSTKHDPAWENDHASFAGMRIFYATPRIRFLIRIPHYQDFLDLRVLNILKSRHPEFFRDIRSFLLCHVAFWYKEQETLFMLDEGAPVDIGKGWILARFAYRKEVYHHAMIDNLVHRYGACMSQPFFGLNYRGNVLAAVLIQHNDEGYLMQKLLAHAEGQRILAKDGRQLIKLAINHDNVRAAIRCINLYQALVPADRWCVGQMWFYALWKTASLMMLKGLADEYGDQIHFRHEAIVIKYYVSGLYHRKESSVLALQNEDVHDFELLEWLFQDRGLITQGHLRAAYFVKPLHTYLYNLYEQYDDTQIICGN